MPPKKSPAKEATGGLFSFVDRVQRAAYGGEVNELPKARPQQQQREQSRSPPRRPLEPRTPAPRKPEQKRPSTAPGIRGPSFNLPSFRAPEMPQFTLPNFFGGGNDAARLGSKQSVVRRRQQQARRSGDDSGVAINLLGLAALGAGVWQLAKPKPSALAIFRVEPEAAVVLFLWFEIRRDPVSPAAEDAIHELVQFFLPSCGGGAPELYARSRESLDRRVSCVARAVFPDLPSARAALQSLGFSARLQALASRGLDVSVTGGLYRRTSGPPLTKRDPGRETVAVFVGYSFPGGPGRHPDASAARFPHEWGWAQPYLGSCPGFHMSSLYEAVDRQFAPFPFVSVTAWDAVGSLVAAMNTAEADAAHGYCRYTTAVGTACDPFEL